ncbi:5706_t:CDS:2, partial [Racocetra fulgida]
NEVSNVDIFIASDEIGLFEVSQQVEKRLLETESAWKFPNDFITISRYKNILPNNILDEIYLYLSGTSPKNLNNNLLKRESAYSFDSNIINARDAALIASWIDKKQGMPYRFKDMPFKFELIYRASLENFAIDKFHKNCDNKGPTVVIIKVRNSEEIIGGYNPLDWYEIDLMKNNSDTFGDYADYKFKSTSKNLWIEYDLLRRSIVGTCKQHSYETAIIDKETFEIEEYEYSSDQKHGSI